jgi:hypothetical protein
MSVSAPLTELDLLRMLRCKYTQDAGNGPAWVFIPHVRNAAGFEATRTADAVAMSVWPSRGLLLHGFEIKVSRADWLRELKNPAKAESFCALVDRWWVVTATADIVGPGELPAGWGLLVARGRSGLRCVTEAKQIGEPELPIDRSFLAALLRACAKTVEKTPGEILEAAAAGRAEAERTWKERVDRAQSEVQELRQNERDFSAASGQPHLYWNPAWPIGVGIALKAAIEGKTKVEQYRNRLANLRRGLADLDADIDSVMNDLDGAE